MAGRGEHKSLDDVGGHGAEGAASDPAAAATHGIAARASEDSQTNPLGGLTNPPNIAALARRWPRCSSHSYQPCGVRASRTQGVQRAPASTPKKSEQSMTRTGSAEIFLYSLACLARVRHRGGNAGPRASDFPRENVTSNREGGQVSGLVRVQAGEEDSPSSRERAFPTYAKFMMTSYLQGRRADGRRGGRNLWRR